MSNIADFEKILDDIRKYPVDLRKEQVIAIINESKVKSLMLLALIDSLKEGCAAQDCLDGRDQIEHGFHLMKLRVIGDE